MKRLIIKLHRSPRTNKARGQPTTERYQEAAGQGHAPFKGWRDLLRLPPGHAHYAYRPRLSIGSTRFDKSGSGLGFGIVVGSLGCKDQLAEFW